MPSVSISIGSTTSAPRDSSVATVFKNYLIHTHIVAHAAVGAKHSDASALERVFRQIDSKVRHWLRGKISSASGSAGVMPYHRV